MTTTTDTYTGYDEAMGGLAAVMAMATGALKRKDYRVAKKLLDDELALLLRSPVLNQTDTPEDEEACRYMREAFREAMRR